MSLERNTERREKNLWFFWGIMLFKNRKIFASERSGLAPDNNR